MAKARSTARIPCRSRAAAIALFALLIQALLPAAALAGQTPGRGETMVLCTAMGVQTVTVDLGADDPAEGFAGLPCPDCLTVASAAISVPSVAVGPVAYLSTEVEHIPTTTEPALRGARAPPRPPSRAPPTRERLT
jgi:hypothetical protein